MFGLANKKKEAAKSELEQTKSWYEDRFQSVVVQRNILLLITLVSLMGLGATTFAVAMLMDSKTFEPYVIEVESKSGIATLVDRRSVETYAANEMVKRYFVAKYVQARESYNINTYRRNYGSVVRVLSSPEIYSRFSDFISRSNPRSPLNLDRRWVRSIRIKSITFLEPKKVQVRILIEDVEQKGSEVVENHAIVTMDFDFFDLDLSNDERYINPLGFRVTSYVIEEDVL